MDAENLCEQGKIIGRDGRPIEAVFHAGTGVKWLDGPPAQDHVPTAYEVRALHIMSVIEGLILTPFF